MTGEVAVQVLRRDVRQALATAHEHEVPREVEELGGRLDGRDDLIEEGVDVVAHGCIPDDVD